jgi:hypothetical protein
MIGGGPKGFSPLHAVVHATLLFCPVPVGIGFGLYEAGGIRRPTSIPGAIGLYGQLIIAAFMILGVIILSG